MNANIFRHEIRMRKGSLVSWALSVAFLILFYFAMFPVFADQAALMNELLARYPAELRAAFGLDRMDLAAVLGFYSFIFIFVQLCLAIQASNYGFGLVSVEESELTADFLLTRPVSRSRVLTSKLLAAAACLTIINLVVWVSTFLAIQLFSDGRPYDRGVLLLLLLSIVPFQVFFLSLGLVISLLVKRVRSVTPFGLGLSFGTYVVNAFSGVFGDIKLEMLTPFRHFDPTRIVANAAFDAPLLLLNLAVSLLALAASYWLYIHRDIAAVS